MDEMPELDGESASPDPLELLSMEEAGVILGVSPYTVKNIADSGQLVVLRVGTGRGSPRTTRSELADYIARLTKEGRVEAARRRRARLAAIPVRSRRKPARASKAVSAQAVGDAEQMAS